MAQFCTVCGVDVTEKALCVQPLEPPRYCPHCRRRMVVQITPTGWSARCSEHGTTSG